MKNSVILAATSVLTAIAFLPAAASAQEARDEWSGVYVGGSFGGTVQPNDTGESVLFDTDKNGSFGDTIRNVSGANAFSTGFCNGAARGATSDAGCRNDRDGIEYFGRVGADSQFGDFVVGIVGEFGHSRASDSVSAFSTTPASYTLTRKAQYQGGIRGRVGYTPGTTLFYATGGAAYARLRSNFATTNTANSFTPAGKSDELGYSAGGGVEQKIGRNFSIGLEYLYTSFPKANTTIAVGPGTAGPTNPFLLVNPTGTTFLRSDSDFNTHSMRVTAAFRF